MAVKLFWGGRACTLAVEPRGCQSVNSLLGLHSTRAGEGRLCVVHSMELQQAAPLCPALPGSQQEGGGQKERGRLAMLFITLLFFTY